MVSAVKIAKAGDKALSQAFVSLQRKLDTSQLIIEHIGGSSWNSASAEKLPTYQANQHIIEKIDLVIAPSNSRITFCRGSFDPNQIQQGSTRQLNHSNFLTYRLASSVYDEIIISGGPIGIEAAKIIDSELSKLKAIQAGSDSGEGDLAALVTTQLDQLRQLSIDFSQRQLEAESRLEKSFRARENALEKRVDSEEKRLRYLQDENNRTLAAEREAIEKWRTEINDREPQHERRDLRAKLTAELKTAVTAEMPATVQAVDRAFQWYFIAAIIFIILSGAFAYISIEQSGSAYAVSAIKGGLSGLAGAAFAWAGLNGLKNSAIAERSYEKSVRRYAFDMDRASWIVETILQMNSNERAQIPDQWLQSVCRGLFDVDNVGELKEHTPLESLATLLDATARANIGSSGINFEIDRKGVKKLVAE